MSALSLKRPAHLASLAFLALALVAGVLGGLASNSTHVAFAADCTTTCYVDVTTGDDGNSGLIAADPLATIQKGVESVQQGGTVIVAPGSYPEDIEIEKSVTLQGPNTGKAGSDPTRGPEADITGGGIDILFTGLVTVDGFKFSDSDTAAIGIQFYPDGATIKNNVFDAPHMGAISMFQAHHVNIHRNAFNNSPPDSFNVISGLLAFQVDVADNTFSNFQGKYLLIGFGDSGNVTIIRNLISNNRCGLDIDAYCKAAIDVHFVDDSLIADNEIEGSPYDAGHAIALRGQGYRNTIRNNYARVHAASNTGVGVYVGDDNHDVTVTLNHLGDGDGANTGLVNDTANLVKAEKNWWGSNTGPGGDANGSGTGVITTTAISPGIDFSPWLCAGKDTNRAIGFQPLATLPAHRSPCF